MLEFPHKARYSMEDLLCVMEVLRGDNGCPWDKEQTHDSIRMNFLEEVYEACDAIDAKDAANLQEELGDVLLQVVFHSKISQENGGFTFDDVTDGICKKLIHRHPHIFGETSVKDSAEVLHNWDAIKLAEKGSTTYTQEMRRVPKALPALMYAEKIQKRAKKAGFDWETVEPALAKVREEAQEVQEAMGTSLVHEEIGDLLFAAVNVARFCKVDPEKALFDASQKFIKRFSYVEEKAGSQMHSMSLQELDKLWDEYKKQILEEKNQ